MIRDIPSKEDFDAVGSALLDQAWETATSLLLDLDEAYEVEEEEIAEYWQSANTRMATALSIAHQGAEFLIKGKIAEVSPFLLIANAPREWPKANSDGDILYSQFRTVDAQDLVRLHDGCATAPLEKDFKEAFDALRVRRNSIMHTVDRRLKIHVVELIESILKIHKSLVPQRDWINARRDALSESSSVTLFSAADWVEPRIVREFSVITDTLSPSAMKEYFGFNKKQRTYICPNCSWDVLEEYGEEVKTAQLRPNCGASTSVWCFICTKEEKVLRIDCKEAECPGNVVAPEWARCLTCGADQDR